MNSYEIILEARICGENGLISLNKSNNSKWYFSEKNGLIKAILLYQF